MRGEDVVLIALRARLLTLGADIPATRKYQGVKFTRPAAGTRWLRETLRTITPQPVGLPAADATLFTDGFYQVDWFIPLTDGPDVGRDILSRACFAFRVGYPNGTIATGSPNVSLSVLRPPASDLIEGDPWNQFYLSVEWRSQVPNAVLV